MLLIPHYIEQSTFLNNRFGELQPMALPPRSTYHPNGTFSASVWYYIDIVGKRQAYMVRNYRNLYFNEANNARYFFSAAK